MVFDKARWIGKVNHAHWAVRHTSVFLFLGLVSASALSTYADGDAKVEPDRAVQRIVLRFDQALVNPVAKTDERHRTLNVVTYWKAGQWDWLLGDAPDFNRSIHRGRILHGTPESETMAIDMDIKSDPWIKGGRFKVELEWDKTVDGVRHGTFKGRMAQKEVSGTVTMTFSSPLVPDRAYEPLKLHEHPRLLFRKSDLPAIKEKLKTPLGQALFKRIKNNKKDPVSLGFMYQITGDKSYAESAMPIVMRQALDEAPGSFRGAGGEYGKRAVSMALALDMCYDAWPEAFREKIIAALNYKARKMVLNPRSISKSVNQSPNSNWMGHMSGPAAIVGLVIQDEPDPNGLEKPIEPPAEPYVIEPDAGKVEGQSIMNEWKSGAVARKWLVAGPFPNRLDHNFDAFASVGGSKSAVPTVGQTISYMDTEHAFKVMPEEYFWNYMGGVIEFMAATKKTFFSTTYFFTYIKVPEDTLVQLRDDDAGIQTQYWLSGQRILRKDPIMLKAGVHRLLVRGHWYKINPWGKAWIRPRFEKIEMEQANAVLIEKHDQYALDLAKYNEDRKYTEENKGASAAHRWIAMCGAFRATQYHRYVFGDGGFQTEGEVYLAVGSYEPILFEVLYRNTNGTPSTGRPDVTHLGPRVIMQTIYGQAAPKQMQSFSLSDMLFGTHRWELVYKLSPDKYRPAVLWAWNMSMGIKNGGVGKTMADRMNDDAFVNQVASNARSPLKALLHYPLDVKPQNPMALLPKTWEARTKGLYVFRNGWKDEQDIVAQVFLKAEGEGGWQNPDGGSFRLYGLGHRWTDRGDGPGKTRKRWHETVVALPEDETYVGMRGVLKHWVPEVDGSGSVLIDMDLIYKGKMTYEEKKGKNTRLRIARPVNRGFELVPENLKDLGISGDRMVAVNYNGKSGAEAVIVMVDRIQGGGEKVWQWQVPGGKKVRQGPEVVLNKSGFQMIQNNANLNATFIRPEKVKVTWADRELDYMPAKDRAKKKVKNKPKALYAVDAVDHDNGQFIVIITLQRGDAPSVTTVKSDDELTVVQVGEQKVFIESDQVRFE